MSEQVITLSPQKIYEGAYLAMEQAGRLLQDAALLYEHKRWPSALVFAVLCREEIGRAEILLTRAIESENSGPKPFEEVMRGLANHTMKLTFGIGPDSVTASVICCGDVPAPNSAEEAEINKRLSEAREIVLKNAPRDAHQGRMRSLYVDFGRDGLWSRPADVSQDDAYLAVSAACIEYDARHKKFAQPRNDQMVAVSKKCEADLPKLADAPRIEWPRD